MGFADQCKPPFGLASSFSTAIGQFLLFLGSLYNGDVRKRCTTTEERGSARENSSPCNLFSTKWRELFDSVGSSPRLDAFFLSSVKNARAMFIRCWKTHRSSSFLLISRTGFDRSSPPPYLLAFWWKRSSNYLPSTNFVHRVVSRNAATSCLFRPKNFYSRSVQSVGSFRFSVRLKSCRLLPWYFWCFLIHRLARELSQFGKFRKLWNFGDLRSMCAKNYFLVFFFFYFPKLRVDWNWKILKDSFSFIVRQQKDV